MYRHSSVLAPFIFSGKIDYMNYSVYFDAFSCQSLKALLPNLIGCWIGGVSTKN